MLLLWVLFVGGVGSGGVDWGAGVGVGSQGRRRALILVVIGCPGGGPALRHS